MKKWCVLMLVALFAICAGTNAFSQISIDATVNLPSPVGDWGDVYDTGFGAAADVFVGVPFLNMSFGGRVAYNRFPASDDFDDGHMTMTEIIPSVRYTITPPLSPIKLYGQFGIGMYNWSSEIDAGAFTAEDDGTDYGISIGIGASLKPLPTFGIIAMPMYHVVMTDDDNLDYFTFNVGVVF